MRTETVVSRIVGDAGHGRTGTVQGIPQFIQKRLLKERLPTPEMESADDVEHSTHTLIRHHCRREQPHVVQFDSTLEVCV